MATEPYLQSLKYKEVTVTQDKVEIRKYYYPSGALWVETPCVNGKMHGITKRYYESGAIEWEIPYVNDREHGILKRYYESGTLSWEIPYVNGGRHGVATHYDKDNTNIACLKLYKINREVSTLRCDGHGAVSKKSYI